MIKIQLHHVGRSLMGFFLLLLAPTGVQALHIDLDPPGPREFILDRAGMIDEADQKKIREICDKLLTDKATPIIVVTIESMANHGGNGLRIETFAHLLFDQWEVGHAKLNGANWNTGILLLVSRKDRKSRIELGAGWGHEKDALCGQIMDEQIIPEFKNGNFSGGILAGVVGLEHMARGLELPTRPRPWWHYALIVVFISLAIFTVVSLIRKGASGWAWVFWVAVFAIIGGLLYAILTSKSSGGGGGGGGGSFSGGSFGGGFSGGGGATGSW